MRNIYCKAGGTGDGSTIDKAADLQAIAGRVQPGDKVLIHAGDVLSYSQWPVFNRKIVSGITIAPYDGTQFTIRSAVGLTFMLSDDVQVQGMVLEQLGRDPHAPGFDPAKVPAWDNGIHLLNCNRFKATDCVLRFWGNGICAESSDGGDAGGVLTRLRLEQIYVSDSSTQGQGVFFNGQTGWLLDDCDFDTIGWTEVIPATATMFRHGTYSKSSASGSGAFIARNSRFRKCASSALTADTGGEYDHCVVWLSSNVPAGQPGAGAHELWTGGLQGSVHHCIVYTLHNGILFESLAGDVHDNTIFQMGAGSPITIDLQKSPHVPASRGPTDKVNVYANTVIYAQPPSSPAVNVVNGGPPGGVSIEPPRVFGL